VVKRSLMGAGESMSGYRFAVILSVLVISACSSLTVVPLDSQQNVLNSARIKIDGSDAGSGAVQIKAKEGSRIEADAGPEWIASSVLLGPDTPKRIEIRLRPNDLYLQTVSDANKVVNQWISLTVSPLRTNTWWTSAVSAISGSTFEIAIMDASSGFIRTAWRERAYEAATIRRRFVGSIVTQSPLVWRVRYEVEADRRDGRSWQPYDRAFADELQILQEIRARIE